MACGSCGAENHCLYFEGRGTHRSLARNFRAAAFTLRPVVRATPRLPARARFPGRLPALRRVRRSPRDVSVRAGPGSKRCLPSGEEFAGPVPSSSNIRAPGKSRACGHTSTAAPGCALRRRRCTGATNARMRVDGTGERAGRWFELRFTQLRARETYREGLLNIRSQSWRGVLGAGPNCELCWRMVMLCFSPACANLREGRGEGNGKALNGEKFMANGFCSGLKCESRRFWRGRFAPAGTSGAKALLFRTGNVAAKQLAEKVGFLGGRSFSSDNRCFACNGL